MKFMKFINGCNFLREETDGILGGGAGSGDTGTGDTGSGNAGDSGIPGGDTGGDSLPTMPEWLSGVDSNLAGDPSLKNIKDMDGLVKSYIHAQKLVGADKMLVPNQNTSDEDWKSTFHKLGLPETREEYKADRGEDSKIAEDFHSNLVEKAYELNLLPNQLKGILDFYEGSIGDAESKHIENMNSQQSARLETLKQEWGDGFNRKAAAANKAIDSFGGDDLRNHIKSLGLSNDAQIIKMFANIGEQLHEDDFSPSDTAGFANTPDQAQIKMNSMLEDGKNPIHNPQHANYAAAQAEYNKLAKQAAARSVKK